VTEGARNLGESNEEIGIFPFCSFPYERWTPRWRLKKLGWVPCGREEKEKNIKKRKEERDGAVLCLAGWHAAGGRSAVHGRARLAGWPGRPDAASFLFVSFASILLSSIKFNLLIRLN
jgi:hypothetical protein